MCEPGSAATGWEAPPARTVKALSDKPSKVDSRSLKVRVRRVPLMLAVSRTGGVKSAVDLKRKLTETLRPMSDATHGDMP